MDADARDKYIDLVEINLLYARAEMLAGISDAAALLRSFEHIERALKDIRNHKRATGKRAKAA
ncbi:hypothetical protein M2323_001991 [Rhodoblastus acidophilus]|uniref:hypothetical protein n=1 Tax=Rhodoblastus acidophilus TaxID=1074 RepID=UPI0022255399|nr:hypothetical protein [Rhodoblastus acidophilus]MCW2285697.1 hypothetical protein [Rhodoblastus acidophilus]MCW2333069.1 hypothetical protein [Rhodoblastus acidophilus]